MASCPRILGAKRSFQPADRSFGSRCLAFQVDRFSLPVRLGIEVREAVRKSGVGPPSGEPAGVVYVPKAPKRLDQSQPLGFEVSELPIALQEDFPLALSFGGSLGNEHPKVLDCRSFQHVVEVEEEPTVAAVKQVAEVAISVNPMPGHVLGS